MSKKKTIYSFLKEGFNSQKKLEVLIKKIIDFRMKKTQFGI